MNAKPGISNPDLQKNHVDARDAATRAPFQFSVRTLVALVTMAGMACGLVGMWVSHAREAARQSGCLYNTRMYCITARIHEEKRGRYPLATTSTSGLLVDRPADARNVGTDAGISWCHWNLRYCQIDCRRHGEIQEALEARVPAFHPSVCRNRSAGGACHWSTIQFGEFHCPSNSRPAVVNVKLAPEYQLTHPAFSNGVATGNYVAIAGTHIEAGDVVENGVLISGKANGGKGLRKKDISDGVSHTMIFTESRERGYASWYDGTCGWVVGVPDGFAATDSDGDGRLDMQRSPITAINYGSNDGSKVYLRAGTWGGQNARRWGASSEHAGGQVVHGFADVHAKFLTAKVDPTVYVQLITRAGGEPVTGALLNSQ